MIASENNYYIASGALYISPNVEGDARRIGVSLVSGSIVKVYVGSAIPFFNTGATGAYKSWMLRASNTYLGEVSFGKHLYIYLRIQEGSSYADLTFTVKTPTEYTLEGVAQNMKDENGEDVKDQDGNVVKTVTHYVRIGELNYDGGKYTLSYSLGNLDTDHYRENVKNAMSGMFEVVLSDKDGTTFLIRPLLPFVSLAAEGLISSLEGLVAPVVTLAGRAVNYILGTDDNAQSDSDSSVVSAGFLNGSWLRFIRSLFVRKDVETVEVMQGGLSMAKTLDVGEGATVDTLRVKHDASVEGNISTIGTDTALSHKTRGFVEGEMTGSGAGMWEENFYGNPVGHVETDFLSVRKSAFFRELTIEEVKHIGGEMILSQAASMNARVAGYDGTSWVFDTAGELSEATECPEGKDRTITYYRLFFDKEANGKTAYNEWRVGDQCRCWSAGGLGVGTSEMVRTTYYWRLVIAVHEAEGEETQHYIDVSNLTTKIKPNDDILEGPGCDVGCTVPQVNDSLALLGCRDRRYPSRTSAQVFSTAEANSPSRRYYHSIRSFSFANCAIETMEWDSVKSFPHWKVGDDRKYIDFSKEGLKIRASEIRFGVSDTDIETAIDDAKQAAMDYVSGELEGGFTVHSQTDAEAVKSRYPIPNNFDPDDNKVFPYLGTDKTNLPFWGKTPDDYTAALELEKNVGNYYLTKEGLLFCLLAEDGGYYWNVVADKYLIDAIKVAEEAKNRADQAIEVVANFSGDGKITVSEKIILKDTWEGVVVEYESLLDDYDYLKRNVEGFDDENVDDYNLLVGAYNALKRDMDIVLAKDTWNSSIDIKTKFESTPGKGDGADVYMTHWSNYRTHYGEIYYACSTGKFGFFTQTSEMTKLGNTFFERQSNGTYVVKEGGLVTTAETASIVAKQVKEDLDGRDIVTQAEVTASVEEGISNVRISAEQVELNGYMTINGAMRIDEEGNLFAHGGSFGGMQKHSTRVICSANYSQYGYMMNESREVSVTGKKELANEFILDLDKVGNNVMLYSYIDGTQNSLEPHLSDSRFAPMHPYICVMLPGYIGSDNIRYGWMGARDVYKSREYVGNKFVITSRSSSSVRVTGDILVDGEIESEVYLDPNHVYEFECVRTAFEKDRVDYDSVVWKLNSDIIAHIPLVDGKYYFITPFTHYSVELLTYYDLLDASMKYELKQEWTETKSVYMKFVRAAQDGASWLPGYQAAFNNLRKCLEEDEYEIQNEANTIEEVATMFDDDYVGYYTYVGEDSYLKQCFVGYYAIADRLSIKDGVTYYA